MSDRKQGDRETVLRLLPYEDKSGYQYEVCANLDEDGRARVSLYQGDSQVTIGHAEWASIKVAIEEAFEIVTRVMP